MYPCRVLPALAIAAVCASCSGEQVLVSEVMNHDQCRDIRKGLTQISYRDLAQIRGATLLEPSTAPAAEASDAILLAVYQGPRRSARHLLRLDSATARGELLQLSYSWRAPTAKADQPLVMRSPCSILRIEHADRLSTIRVLIDNRLLDEITLSAE